MNFGPGRGEWTAPHGRAERPENASDWGNPKRCDAALGTFAYVPPTDEVRRIVWAVMSAHMRRGGLDAAGFRKRYPT